MINGVFWSDLASLYQSLRKEMSEFFNEQRELGDLWKQAFPVEIACGQFHLLSEYNWNFSNLEDEFKEGGVLHGEKVYLFGCLEPQVLFFGGESQIICVPALVAIAAPFPPSDKIGVMSVHSESEEVIDMEHMNMGWLPCNVPIGEGRERHVPQLFLLSRLQREATAAFELNPGVQYALPYFKNPFKVDETEHSTVFDIIYPTEAGIPIVAEFDWELDELEEFTDDLIAAGDLPGEDKDGFKEFVEERVEQGKRANHEAMEKRIQAQEELRAEEKADAVENMRFYKFYPVATSDTPDVSHVKARHINRYYGNAHQLF